MKTKYMANILFGIITLFCSIFVGGCVGPEEPLDGLIDNIPVVVNTPEAFTFSLLADNYSTEETYSLNFPNATEKKELVITLVSTEYRGNPIDTTAFWVINSQDSLLHIYRINTNMVVVEIDSVSDRTTPKTIYFKSANFTGRIELVLANNN